MFEEITGHFQQIEILKNDLAQGNVAHAYFFSGPSSIGKFKTAMAFAKALQSKNLDQQKSAIISQQIDQGTHLDTFFLRNNGEAIKIEYILHIIQDLYLSGNSPYRILVLEDVERLTPESSNALLKILEEPPGNVLFLLTSSQPHLILETILSRVRTLPFSLISKEEILKTFQEKFPVLSDEQRASIARLSFGKIGKAICFAQNPNLFEKYSGFYLEVEDLFLKQDTVKTFGFIEKMAKDKNVVRDFLEIAAFLLREKLLNMVQHHENSGKISSHIALLEDLQRIYGLSSTNVNMRILLENFFLTLWHSF